VLPTLAQVLALEAVRRGQPRVVVGADRLSTPVRWVHAIELADVARLLRGGELVLTTGIALPDDDALLEKYVAELTGIGASGLAVELGRRYTSDLPDGLASAARAQGLPLIVFEREVAFVEITEAVHAQIIDDQLEELRTSARLHEVFTDLAVAGAGPAEIIRQASLLAGRPVILADLAHHVLAFEAAGADPARLLDRFEARSRAVAPTARTAYDEPSGWLVTTVGARGEDWGRVILVCGGSSGPATHEPRPGTGRPGTGRPRPADVVLVERTATTLALGRLLTRQQESLERQAHTTIISSILAQPSADPDEIAVRARALGVPVTGRQLVPAVIRFRDGSTGLGSQARVLEIADLLVAACRAERVPVLVGALDEGSAGALLSLSRGADPDQVLTRVCQVVLRRTSAGRATRRTGLPGPVIGTGSVLTSMAEVRRGLLEAQQAADGAACCTYWRATSGSPPSWSANSGNWPPMTRATAPT
jgi:purine catabolism regulator